MTSPGTSEPRDPQPLIDRFTELCASDEQIVAAFLGGSHARGTADAFSDVDFGLVVSEEVENLAGLRRRIIHRLGDVLFLEDFGTEVTSFFILHDGTEAELSTGHVSDFLAIHAGPFRVLHDPEGILDGVTFPWRDPEPEERRTTLHEVLFWFWHELSHFSAAIGRGQLWWAAGQLEALRGHCVNLVRIDQGVEAGEEPYEKLDLAIDPGRLEPIRSTFVPLEREAMLRAARDLVRFFTETAPAVAEAHGTTYPAELARLMVKRLDDLNATD